MKRLSYAKKRDENEKEIVRALEAIGAYVFRMDKPVDLLVGYRGKTFLMEVKSKDGKLTDDQQIFVDLWKGDKIYVIRTTEKAIETITK